MALDGEPPRRKPLVLDDIGLTCFMIMDARGVIDASDGIEMLGHAVRVRLSCDDAFNVLRFIQCVRDTFDAFEQAELRDAGTRLRRRLLM